MSDYIATDINASYTNADQLKTRGYKVVDLSKYQAEFVEAIVEGSDNPLTAFVIPNYDGAILRIGYRGYGTGGTLATDPYFRSFFQYIRNSARYQSGKFAVGVYFFTQAITITEAREEVNYVRNIIDTLQISRYDNGFKLPLYVDVEGSGGRGDQLNAAQRTAIIKAWLEQARTNITENVGVYASESWFKVNPVESERNCFDSASIFRGGVYDSVYSCWVAKYNRTTPPTVRGYLDGTTADNRIHWEGWQYTNSEIVNEGDPSHNYYSCDCSVFVKSGPWNGVSPTPTPVPGEVKSHLSEADIDFFIEAPRNYNGQPHNYRLHASITNPAWAPYETVELYLDQDYVIESIDVTNYPGTVTLRAIIENFYTDETVTIQAESGARINRINLSNASHVSIASTVSSYVYDGTAKRPPLSVKFTSTGGTMPASDYKVTYSNNVNVGTLIATVEANSDNVRGSKSIGVPITPFDIKNATITLPGGTKYKYTGSPISPQVSVTGLPQGAGVAVGYQNNVNVGTASAIVTGTLNCTGTVTKNFRISYFNMSKVAINLSANSFIYNGKPQVPSYTISGDDPVLDVDYVVEYENYASTDVGMYSITFRGIGEYTGSQTKFYSIEPKKLTDGYVGELVDPEEVFLYRAHEFTPDAKIEGLIKDVDFVVSYEDNIDVGMATIYFTGIGNYTDVIATNFYIDYNDLINCVAKYGFPTMKSKYRVEDDQRMRLYADEGMHYQFTENVDFVIEDQDMDAFDDFALISIDVTGLGGLTGSLTYRFRIIDEEPDRPYDFNDDGVYNFGDIDLHDETAVGGYTFDDKLNKDGTPNPEILPDEVTKDDENYDFDEMSTMYMADYDIDDGKNIDENGNTPDEQAGRIGQEDDGVYNFEDIDDPDNPLNIPNNNDRNAHYDWGELGEDIEPTTVIIDKRDYDFNKFAGDIDQWVEPGTEYELDNTPLYSTYTIPTSVEKRTGLYFIYESSIKNNRVRVCASNNFVKKPAAASGWCRVDDLINLGDIMVNDVVLVTGKIFAFPNGNGGYVFKTNEPMWVKTILDPLSYEYNYELIEGYNGPTIGYANRTALRLPDYSNI